MDTKMSEAEQVMRDPRSYAAGAIVLKASEVATVLSELDRLREFAREAKEAAKILRRANSMENATAINIGLDVGSRDLDDAIDKLDRATGGEGI